MFSALNPQNIESNSRLLTPKTLREKSTQPKTPIVHVLFQFSGEKSQKRAVFRPSAFFRHQYVGVKGQLFDPKGWVSTPKKCTIPWKKSEMLKVPLTAYW